MTSTGIKPKPDHPSTATRATGRAMRTSSRNTAPTRAASPPRPDRSHLISRNISPPLGALPERPPDSARTPLVVSVRSGRGAFHASKRTPIPDYSAKFLVVQSGPEAADAPAERTFIETARRNQIVAAAIDTIAEVGYAQASLARIAARAGISPGLISYHFAGKDDLIDQVVRDVQAEGADYMQPRIRAEATGSGMLRAYIESNLAFVRDHRNHMAAILEIARNAFTADGRRRFYRDGEAGRPERLLGELLARFQAAGQLRPGFDPTAMAMTIRAAIDAVPPRLVSDPNFDIDNYAAEIATTFHLATRTEEPET
jgi:TetR/AcrR family transcriptional regulator, fatty acid metabolism regulator protein